MGTIRHPLVEEIVDVVPARTCTARRSLAPPPELEDGARLLPLSLQLEYLAAVASRVQPEVTVVGISGFEMATLAQRFPPGCQLVAHAERGEGDAVRVELTAERPGRSAMALGFARADFAHVFPPAPAPTGIQRALLERPRSAYNGPLLYAARDEQPSEVPPALQVVAWAKRIGMTSLAAGLEDGSRLLESAASSQLHTAPGLVEGCLQLARWLWYALMGEWLTISAIGRLLLYRLPRRGEGFLADVQLRSTSAAGPLFDAVVLGPEGLPVLELRGVRGVNAPVTDAQDVRPAWDAFVRLLEDGGEAA